MKSANDFKQSKIQTMVPKLGIILPNTKRQNVFSGIFLLQKGRFPPHLAHNGTYNP